MGLIKNIHNIGGASAPSPTGAISPVQPIGNGNLWKKIIAKTGVPLKSLKPTKADHLDWQDLDDLAGVVAQELADDDGTNRYGVLYDCDVDGVFAGYVMDNYLTRVGKTVHSHMNHLKKHGIVAETLRWVYQHHINYLFVVDAGSGNTVEMQELQDNGVQVVVLDHHPYDRELPLPSKARRLNISDREDLPNLSGCGVTYRFVEALGKLQDEYTKQYEPYVGVTVLSDICDLTDQENRYYVLSAYDNYQGNQLFKQFGYYGSKKSFYLYGVVPYLNRLCRLGETDHVINLVNHLNDGSMMVRVKADVYRVKQAEQDLIWDVKELSKIYDTPSCVLALRHEDNFEGDEDHLPVQGLRSVNGMTANLLINEYHKSALVLCYDHERHLWVGSFRGWNFDNSVLKQWNMKAMGHANACGIEVSGQDLKHFVQAFKIADDKRPAEYLMQVDLDDMDGKDWVMLSKYNELTGDGTGLTPIRLQLDKRVADADEVLVNRTGSKETLHYGDTVITEFTNNDYDDAEPLVVEPTADGKGYQLIRQ